MGQNQPTLEAFIDTLIKKAKTPSRQQLEAAFKSGWMRANATNYQDSYFEHFYNETYGKETDRN